MYIYESHMGGFYKSDELIPYEHLYCDSCGDSDYLLGEANTKEELRSLFTETIREIFLSEYLDSIIEEFFQNDNQIKN